MHCESCNIAVEAAFPPTRLGNLPTEHQRFIEMLVLAGGNLKEIAHQTGVSYPTIRSRLNKIIESLREEISKTSPTRGNLLDALASCRPVKHSNSPEAGAIDAGQLIKSI